LYKGDWDKKPLPSPSWSTLVCFVDTTSFNVSPLEVDPKERHWVEKKTRRLGMGDLLEAMRFYPKMGDEIEINPLPSSPKPPLVPPEPMYVESPHVSPIKKLENDLDMVWMQTPNDLLHVLTELTNEVAFDPLFADHEMEVKERETQSRCRLQKNLHFG